VREEKCMLAHFSPWLLGPWRRGVFTSGRQEAERQKGAQDMIKPPRTCPIDLLPPTRPHLLKFPEPPKIAPLTGNQTFNILRGYFIFKP
jgi:hypothetical protein